MFSTTKKISVNSSFIDKYLLKLENLTRSKENVKNSTKNQNISNILASLIILTSLKSIKSKKRIEPKKLR